VDVHDKLDELTKMVESARSMPMSASCIVNRGEVLGLLEELRELLPEEFRHAQLLLQDRDAVLDEGRREVQRRLEDAEVQRARRVAETDVVSEAVRHAEQIRAAAVEEAQSMRDEVDDYVDTKLANFEVVLDKTLSAVHRGRDKLRGRSAAQELSQESLDRVGEPDPDSFSDGSLPGPLG
jgi:cell division septum initiation protein DivIVA